MPYSAMELAEAFLKTGELEEAREALQQQLKQHPNDDTARRLYIQVQMRLLPSSDLAQLAIEFDQLVELSVDDYQLKSVILERTGQLGGAIQAIHQAHQLAPDNERIIERLLDLLLANENYDDALALVRQQAKSWQWLEREGDVLVLMGDDILATARYGLVLSHLERLDGTIRDDYLHALKARVMLARAHAYRRLGHTDPARQHYLSAQAIVGEDVTIQFNLGLLAYLDGDIDTSIMQCESALDTANELYRANMLASLDQSEDFADLKAQLGV